MEDKDRQEAMIRSIGPEWIIVWTLGYAAMPTLRYRSAIIDHPKTVSIATILVLDAHRAGAHASDYRNFLAVMPDRVLGDEKIRANVRWAATIAA